MKITQRYFNSHEINLPKVEFWKTANIPDVEKFLETCKINKTDRYGYTPLMWASRYNNYTEVIKLLLERGANIKLVDHLEWNSVMLACRYNENIEIAKFLIQYLCEQRSYYGGRVNKFGCNEIMLAMYKKQPLELIEFLLEKSNTWDSYNNTVNVYNREGVSPLLLSISQIPINYVVVKLLLNFGAELTKDTILYAVKSKNIDMTQFLFKNTLKEIDNSILPEIFRQVISEDKIDYQMLDILFENGLDVNSTYCVTGWKSSDDEVNPVHILPIRKLVKEKGDKELFNYFKKMSKC